MEFFLITQGHQYLHLLDRYETMGTFLHPTLLHQPHYPGNFWWARGDYLLRLRQFSSQIPLDYCGPEMYLLNVEPPPKALELYSENDPNYDGYQMSKPLESYCNYVFIEQPANHPDSKTNSNTDQSKLDQIYQTLKITFGYDQRHTVINTRQFCHLFLNPTTKKITIPCNYNLLKIISDPILGQPKQLILTYRDQIHIIPEFNGCTTIPFEWTIP